MQLQLSKVQQRIWALGLLFATLLMILVLFLWPWYAQLTSYQREIKDLVFRIQRYARVIDSRDEVFEKVERSRAAINDLGYFNNQETPALASAELQTFVKNIIVAAGGVLDSTQVISQVEEAELIHIAVNVRLSGDIEMLRSVLYQIEQAKPLMLIEELDIRPIRGVRNRTTGELEDSGTVSVNMQVASYMRKAR